MKPRAYKLKSKVEAIRYKYYNHEATISELTKENSVTRTAIEYIVLGLSYKDYPGPIEIPIYIKD